MSLSTPEARARVLGERSIAATQLCAERHRVLIGEVDDLNAMAMGGIAGHAGLFSTAADLSAIAAALCRAWRGDDGGGAALVDRDVVRDVLVAVGRRRIDLAARLGRAGGGGFAGGDAVFARRASATSGFTGCSLWIDPARETWIVMLSNRVHPAVPKRRSLSSASARCSTTRSSKRWTRERRAAERSQRRGSGSSGDGVPT